MSACAHPEAQPCELATENRGIRSAGPPQCGHARCAYIGFGEGGAEGSHQADATDAVGEPAAADDNLTDLPPTRPRTRRVTADLDRGTDLVHRSDPAPSVLRLGDGTLTFE